LRQISAERFLELVQTGNGYILDIGIVRMLLFIILMVILGPIEFFKGHNLGDNGIFIYFGGFQLRYEVGDDLFLAFILIKGNGSILGTTIGALSVWGSGVVGPEEKRHKLDICNFLGIIVTLGRFGAFRPSVGHILIGGIGGTSPTIAGIYFPAPFDTFKYGLDTPKAATGKIGRVKVLGQS